jgi:hypothetical protein
MLQYGNVNNPGLKVAKVVGLVQVTQIHLTHLLTIHFECLPFVGAVVIAPAECIRFDIYMGWLNSLSPMHVDTQILSHQNCWDNRFGYSLNWIVNDDWWSGVHDHRCTLMYWIGWDMTSTDSSSCCADVGSTDIDC